MTNLEKYRNQIIEILNNSEYSLCKDFIIPVVLKGDTCPDGSCVECKKAQLQWALEEYKEPEIDWNKVAVDTPVLVSDDGEHWFPQYFSGFLGGKVSTFFEGATSWSTRYPYDGNYWEYAKLATKE